MFLLKKTKSSKAFCNASRVLNFFPGKKLFKLWKSLGELYKIGSLPAKGQVRTMEDAKLPTLALVALRPSAVPLEVERCRVWATGTRVYPGIWRSSSFSIIVSSSSECTSAVMLVLFGMKMWWIIPAVRAPNRHHDFSGVSFRLGHYLDAEPVPNQHDKRLRLSKIIHFSYQVTSVFGPARG